MIVLENWNEIRLWSAIYQAELKKPNPERALEVADDFITALHARKLASTEPQDESENGYRYYLDKVGDLYRFPFSCAAGARVGQRWLCTFDGHSVSPGWGHPWWSWAELVKDEELLGTQCTLEQAKSACPEAFENTEQPNPLYTSVEPVRPSQCRYFLDTDDDLYRFPDACSETAEVGQLWLDCKTKSFWADPAWALIEMRGLLGARECSQAEARARHPRAFGAEVLPPGYQYLVDADGDLFQFPSGASEKELVGSIWSPLENVWVGPPTGFKLSELALDGCPATRIPERTAWALFPKAFEKMSA